MLYVETEDPNASILRRMRHVLISHPEGHLLASKLTRLLNMRFFGTMSALNAKDWSHTSGSHSVVTVKLMATFRRFTLLHLIAVYALEWTDGSDPCIDANKLPPNQRHDGSPATNDP